MASRDKRIDDFIAKAPDFAKPILKELRKRVHDAVPEVTETIKWSMPYFEYGGKAFAGMAAFKAHCAFGFWHPLMRNGDTSLEGMGQFGRIESVKDLPSATEFARLARKAKKLVDDGVKAPKRAAPPKDRVLAVPEDLRALLAKNTKARATFEGFSYSKRKEYVEWIVGAKREETRTKRLETTIAQLAEGKSLMWKYEAKTKTPA